MLPINVSLDDCVQVAMSAMTKTLDKYDLDRGYTLLTYFTWWCRSALQRNWQSTHRLLRLPAHQLELIRSIKKLIKEFKLEKGRTPTCQEIASKLNKSPDVIKQALISDNKTSSLDFKVSNKDGDSNLSLIDLLEDYTYSPNQQLLDQSLLEQIHNALDILTLREREVIELRFGLKTGQPLSLVSLAAVGEHFGFTRENARQIQHKALAKLKSNPDVLSSLKDYALL